MPETHELSRGERLDYFLTVARLLLKNISSDIQEISGHFVGNSYLSIILFSPIRQIGPIRQGLLKKLYCVVSNRVIKSASKHVSNARILDYQKGTLIMNRRSCISLYAETNFR